MRPVSVKEMRDLLDRAVKEGFGSCLLQVSDDEECNDFHCLYNRESLSIGERVSYLDEKDNKTKQMLAVRIN